MRDYIKHTITVISLTFVLFFLFNRFLTPIFAIVVALIIATTCNYFLFQKRDSKIGIHAVFIVSVFLAILFIPLVGEKESKSLEKRTLAEFPEWRWSNVWTFFKGYQAYFDDRFAFRNEIINAHGKMKYEIFQSNALTNKVNKGKDGWLFLNEQEYIDPISTPFTEKELQQFHYNLVVITKWFEKHEIKYYFTIPPVKPRIYPEKLSPYLSVALNFSKIKQLNDYLVKKSTYHFIDYRSELLKGKNNQQLYYKGDTHWNLFGAFIGYTKIINTIAQDFPQITPHQIENFTEHKYQMSTGDLDRLLGYKKSSTTQSFFTLKDTADAVLKYSSHPETHTNGFEEWEMPVKTNGLKAFVIRDSFTEQLKIFLNSNFDRSVYAWMQQIPVKKIAKEKPDIVLHEMLERFTDFYLELPPEIENDTAFTKQFNIEDF